MKEKSPFFVGWALPADRAEYRPRDYHLEKSVAYLLDVHAIAAAIPGQRPMRLYRRVLMAEEQAQIDAWPDKKVRRIAEGEHVLAPLCRPRRLAYNSGLTTRPRQRGTVPPAAFQALHRKGRDDHPSEVARRRYKRKIDAAPVLSREEQAELHKAWRDRGDQRAGDKLAMAHMRLAVAAAHKKWRHDGIDTEDKISAGAVGIVAARETFDPDRGVPFGFYAADPTRNEIREYARNAIGPVRVPRPKVGEKLVTYQGVSLDAPTEGVDGAFEPLGANLSSTVSRYEDAVWCDAFDENAYRVIAEQEAERIDGALMAVKSDRRDLLRRAIRSLSIREHDIFAACKLADPPQRLAHVAERHGVSAERVRQLRDAATKKVTQFMVAEAAEACSRLEAKMQRRRSVYRAQRLTQRLDAPLSEAAAWYGPWPWPRHLSSYEPGRRARGGSIAPRPQPCGRSVDFGWTLCLPEPLRQVAEQRIATELRRISCFAAPESILDRLGIRSLDFPALCGDAFLRTVEPELLAA